MSANDIQEGGNHYKQLLIEPWQVIEVNKMGFFDGNALKYIMRFGLKGGVEDLRKARHYIDKLIEMEQAKVAASVFEKNQEDRKGAARSDVMVRFADGSQRFLTMEEEERFATSGLGRSLIHGQTITAYSTDRGASWNKL